MRCSLITGSLSVALACSAATSTPAGSRAEAAAPVSGTASPAATLESVGLDPLAMDRSANPCSDFYQFACGGWLQATDIPPDESRWIRSFQEMNKRTELELKRLLETASGAPASSASARAIGTFYAACMDESGAEALGAQPIAELLAHASTVTDVAGVVRALTELHASGVWAIFSIAPVQDPSDATRWLAGFDQGGLGLPDRDYYLKDDADSQKIRAFYQGHVERMLGLAGMAPARAKQGAASVLRIETELAKFSKSRVERRDPKGMFNRMDLRRFGQLTPAIDWSIYQRTLGAAVGGNVNVAAPKFFEGVQAVLKGIEPSAWQAYLQWHVVRDTAPTLAKPFVDEAFALEQLLTGQAEQRPRWRRCVRATNNALGDLLGQAYVEANFAGESKSAAVAMVKAISAAFGAELDRLDWMDDATRRRAHDKLDRMAYLIGYPSKWKTYQFPIDPKNYARNALRASAFEISRELGKVGTAVDRDEWEATPPTVDAFYDAQRHHMVFPAGILQPPMYDVKFSVPVNLGAIGMVVGHELTHGFDDEGSQYDAQGNLSNWWEPAVGERFRQRTGCLSRQYSAYEVQPGAKINGDLTLGENIADLGGVKLAFQAYRAMRKDAERVNAGGFSEDQQFFLAMGQAWCTKARPEAERLRLKTDAHSPPRFRVLGSISSLPEFWEAFSCAPPPSDQSCSVW